MSQQTEKLAVLFADICGSTSLYERLGDDKARRLIATCLATMTARADACGGTLVKTIGDEIMCIFAQPEQAMDAACAMQDAIENGAPEAGQPLHIRIGFHYGEVIREAGDVFGDTVNVAARVASITRGCQILTTRAAADALPPAKHAKLLQIMRAELKGKQEQLDIFRVAWEADDSQCTRVGTSLHRKTQETAEELTLTYRGTTLGLNELRKAAVLGRGDGCDLVVRSDFASRQHARVELRLGKFIITDQSTNGTFVRFADGQTVRLAREELVLRGSGSLSLGQAYSDQPTELVEFSISAMPA